MRVCAVCGKHNEISNRFCPDCGNALTGAPPSPEVDDGQLRSIAHERKFVTVLFADLCNSTVLVGDADPEEAQDRLAVAIAAMCESVEAYGGTISQLLGDGVLALFGAPLTQEDHALRACLAAIAIQQRTRSRSIGPHPLQARVGLHSGEVVVGSARQYLSTHYRADGSTLHIASRLEKMAHPGTVLMTSETLRWTGGAVEARSTGRHAIRGVRDEWELFVLETTGQRSAAAPLARRQTLGPLVGREQLLLELQACMQACAAGERRVLGLRGEAGVGKSRLLLRAADDLRRGGFRVYALAPRPYAADMAYDLASELTRELLGLAGMPESAQRREAAIAEMEQWPTAQVAHRLAVNDLLGIAQSDGSWNALTPPQRQRQMVDALGWLIDRQASLGPLAIMIDDLHQADAASVRLLDQVLPRLAALPLLLLAGYRPEFAHRWSEADWFGERRVEPLSRPDMSRLSSALLGSHASVEELSSLLVERADGNPFFLEQLVMTLVDDHSLVGAPSDYRCLDSTVQMAVPVSIASVISARVDRLTPASKGTLEAAAILGESFSIQTIAAMQQLDAEEAERQLALAVASGLLKPHGQEEADAYAFRHALVREVMINALTRPRTRNLHRAAFIALHSQFGERDPELFPLLARHAQQGELWLECAAYSLKSMARSIARSAVRDSLAMFELGLEAVGHQEAGDAALKRAELKLRMKALGALMPIGKPAPIIANLERASAIARELADPRSEAAAALQLVFIQWVRGEYQLGLEAAETASHSAAATGNRMLQMAAVQARLLLCHGQGRYTDVLHHAAEAQQKFADELSLGQMLPGWAAHPACNVLQFKADCLWRMGEFEAAQQALDECYRTLAANEHVFTRLVVDFVQGEVWLAGGRPAEAAALLEKSMALCKSNDIPSMFPPLLASHCIAMAGAGHAEQAAATLQQAYDDKVYQAGGRYNEYYYPRGLAVCQSRLGRHEEALRWARAARAAADVSDQQGHSVDAQLLEGACLAALGRQEPAIACLEEVEQRALARAMTLSASQAREIAARLRAGAVTSAAAGAGSSSGANEPQLTAEAPQP